MKVYLEPSDVELLEEAATNLRDRLMIRLLFRLGCRISEALGLQVQDIDFSEGTVIIQHLKCRVELFCDMCGARLGATHIFCPKCGAKRVNSKTEERLHRRQRMLPVDNDSLEMLKEYITRGGPVVRNGEKLIFGINRHRGWQIVRDCGERAGLSKLVNPETGRVHNVSPHRLRDAFAVHAMKLNDTGDGLRLLQTHLGHQSFNTTAKYRKISGTEHEQWYQKLWSKKD
ncbi:MAG: tyrosine-type recombinase/integrase [Dehalococcoidia bacterium]|nr:tyrosine-type recombinase/integrase [Dehalococcoidia bacterium]